MEWGALTFPELILVTGYALATTPLVRRILITNMLQPFWALPLLAITGLEARQIMGYTLVVMILAAPVFMVALTLF